MKALDDGVVLFSPDATRVSQAIISNKDGRDSTGTTVLPAIHAPHHALGYGLPNLISRRTAAKVLGVSPDNVKTQSTTVWLRLPHTPTAKEGDRLQHSLMDVTGSSSEFIWEEGYSDVFGTVMRWSAVVGTLLAVCVGAVVLALTLSDSRGSRTAIASVGGVEGDPETNGGSTGPRDDRAWSSPWLSRGVCAGCRYDVRRLSLADTDATAVAGAHRVRPTGVVGFSDDGRRTSAATTDAATGLTPTAPRFPS